MSRRIVPSKPYGLLRWFFRLPVCMFRVGMGGLMPWWVMLTTIGRRTGSPHRVVVDIVKHDGDGVYVVAAYGTRADWIRNLQANRSLKAQIGWRQHEANAEFLPKVEAASFLLDLYRSRPVYSRSTMRLVGVRINSEEDVLKATRNMLVIRIKM